MKELQDENNLKKRKRDVSTYAKYSAMGFQMFAIIGAFAYAGYRLDNSRKMESPLFTAFFSLLGVFIALYLVIRSIKKLEP